MFKQRLLTTLILVPLVLLLIYFAKPCVFGLIVLLFVVVAGWEWLQLIPLKELYQRLIFMIVLLCAVWLCDQMVPRWLLGGLLLWGLILWAVLTYPKSQSIWGHRVIVASMCLVLLPLVVSTFKAIYIQEDGKNLIVYLLCLVWSTDIGAYLAGKSWGRHRLIPLVSPGKTVEGTAGGFVLAMLVALVGFFYFKPMHAGMWFCVAVSTIFISMLGDLFISMLKRRCQLKDTGQIFPGHGGVLDRVDSLIAALPVFYSGLHYGMLGY